MNKAQFVEALTERLNADKKAAADALDAVIDTVYATIAKGEKITLTGFGVFEKRERAARTARNPATGAAVKVKKTSVPAFRAGAEFKAITSGAKKIAKAPAKKVAPVKKAVVAKAAPVKKAVATKTAPAKKTVATKAAPVAKAVAKKTAAVSRTVAKAPAKKAPVKKAPAKRAPAKKA